MFGRILDIYIKNDNKEIIHLINSSQGENNLKCEGTITNFSGTEIDKMTLNIKNLSPVLRGEILVNKKTAVEVVFGYEDEDYTPSVIFSGTLQRSIFQREDANTTNTKMYVWDSGDFKSYGFISKTYDDGVNYYQIAQDVLNSGDIKISSVLSAKLKNYVTEKPLTFYCSQDEALSQIAQKTGTIYKTQNNIAYLLSPEDTSSDIVSFTKEIIEDGKTKVVSASGLIGIPQLTTDGVEFDCLINPRIKIYGLVRINNVIISNSQEGDVIPDVEFGATLDREGLYRVVKITTTFTNYDGDCKMSIKALSKSAYDQLTD